MRPSRALSALLACASLMGIAERVLAGSIADAIAASAKTGRPIFALAGSAT